MDCGEYRQAAAVSEPAVWLINYDGNICRRQPLNQNLSIFTRDSRPHVRAGPC
jgi:hypothetical protein